MCDEKEKNDMPTALKKLEKRIIEQEPRRKSIKEIFGQAERLPCKDGVIQLDRNNPKHREWYEDVDIEK